MNENREEMIDASAPATGEKEAYLDEMTAEVPAEPQEEPIPRWHDELCRFVLDEWEKGQSHVYEMNALYDDIYDMIRGERPTKNYEWQSNVVINKVFQIIWTAIPYLMAKIFGASPIVAVQSFDRKGAWQREKLIEFWNTMQCTQDKSHVTYFTTMTLWLLRAALNGVGFVKKGWHQKLDKVSQDLAVDIPDTVNVAGEVSYKRENKKYTVTIPLEDWPVNQVVNNKDIVVDWNLQPGQSCRHGRFVIHRSLTDLDSLRLSEIKYENLDRIPRSSAPLPDDHSQDHSAALSRDGLDCPPDSEVYTDVEVYERVGLVPVIKFEGDYIPVLNKDVEDYQMKHMIVTVAKTDAGNTLIRWEPNPYDQINYIDMQLYLDEERWNPVGLIEPVKDLQTANNDLVNGMMDQIWQNLMPPVMVNKFGIVDWDTIQYAPQQRWLVGGNPAEVFMFKEPSNITRDAWQELVYIDAQMQLIQPVNATVQGQGKENKATTSSLNAQFSMGRLDFLVKMIEQTALIPSAQMDLAFAKKFAHPLTIKAIIGEPMIGGEWEDIYHYRPAAAGVKLDVQKDTEIQQDLQLIQVVSTINNPNTPKIVNKLLANIFRNRDMPMEAQMLDENYFEPSGEAGQLQMLQKVMGNKQANQSGVPMGQAQAGMRQKQIEGMRGGMNG